MAAAKLKEPLTIEKGTTVSFTVSLLADGVAVNLTGSTCTAHIRAGTIQSPGEILLEATTPATRLSFSGSPTLGVLQYTATPDDTADEDLPIGDCVMELCVEFADESVTRVFVEPVQVIAIGGLT